MKCIHFACLGMAGSLLAGSVLLENIASAGIIEDLASATILEDFQFDDDEDTLWSAAANSANPGNFLSPSAAEDQTSLADVVTNGAGALSADTKANTQNGRMLVDTPNNVTFGRVLGVMEVTWDFQSALDTAENEELRLTLINSLSTSVTAEWEIQREDDDTLTIQGTAVGGSSIPAQVLNSGSLTQSTKFVAVVDANLNTDKYYVHFSADGGSTFTTIGPGDVDPARIVDKMRIYFNNDLSGDNVLVDRAYLATIVPEPSSFLLLALCGCLVATQRGRAR